jgi:outer membrane protein OmpA-like peptidoglycan-associated protein
MYQKNQNIFILTVFVLLAACQKTPSIEKFSGKNSVPKGETGTLSWETKNAKKVYLRDNKTQEKKEVSPIEKKFVFQPTQDFSYTLIIEQGKKTIEKEFKGKVVKNLPIFYDVKGTNELTMGENKEAFLEWKTRKATKVLLKIDNIYSPVDLNGKINLLRDTTRTYQLLALNDFGDTAKAEHKLVIKPNTINISLANEFGSPELIAEDNNVLTWNCPDAEYVKIDCEPAKQFKPTDTYIIRPHKDSASFQTKLYVKYPNIPEPKVFLYNAGVVPIKIRFVTSKTKANLYDKIVLSWNTEGAKSIKLIIDDEELNNQKKKDNYTFTIKKPTKVQLVATDKNGQIHTRIWNIKCGERRPFIKNAIDYQTFKSQNAKNVKARLIADIFQIDRTKFPNEIKLRILVTDTLGNFVRGLAPPTISEKEARNFFIELVESIGTQQQTIKDMKIVEINHLISQPYDVSMCLDYSGSMLSDIQALESAMQKLINKKNEEDKMSIVRFDDKLVTESKMTLHTDSLLKNIKWEGMKGFGGSTALYAGIDEALVTFDSLNKNRQKILFVFTDGHENSSFSHASKGRAFTALQVAKKARKYGVKLYPIGLGDGVNDDLLRNLGWVTDGSAIFIDNKEEIDAVYTELPRIFRNYYEITYKPIQTKTEEGKREITLKYNNQKRQVSTSTFYQTNDKYNFDEYETNYFSKGTGKSKMKVIVPPQAVAFFDFDKANLKPKFTANIESIITFLKSNSNAKALVLGHTDLVGTHEKNMTLSKQRAEEIQKYLIQKGIDSKRITIEPLGKTKPIWKEEKEAWQAQENRRIEIVIWE